MKYIDCVLINFLDFFKKLFINDYYDIKDFNWILS